MNRLCFPNHFYHTLKTNMEFSISLIIVRKPVGSYTTGGISTYQASAKPEYNLHFLCLELQKCMLIIYRTVQLTVDDKNICKMAKKNTAPAFKQLQRLPIALCMQ